MNTLFWIIVAVLIVAALAILLPPLLSRRPLAEDDHSRRNIAIARQRLAELKQQLQDGVLTQIEFDDQYAELQLMLNDDLQSVDADPQPAGQGRWMVPVLAITLPCLSLFIYLLLGDANAMRKAELQQTDQQTAANIEAMVAQLQQRLKQQPDDEQGWMMLGRSYSYLQQYQNAADAFAELYRRKSDDVEVMLQYANNLAMARDGQMDGEPAQLAAKVLQRQADNTNALWPAGMAAAQAGNYAGAEAHWRKLAGLLPPDSESLQQVRQMLAELESKNGQAAPAAKPVTIKVSVDIDQAVKAKAAAGDTLFIYAQAMNGPKMPLAIVRKQVAELPLSVELNDAMAMQGGSRLGDQSRLKIVARVSRSGQAMTAAGDLFGSVELGQPFDQATVSVSINQEVK